MRGSGSGEVTPAGEHLWVLQNPLSQVESSFPGHQARRSLGDHSHVFQKADGVSGGLRHKNHIQTNHN